MKTKKELKEEYKQMKFSMGVFQVRNLENNKVLIDNSVDMSSKWNRHQTELNFGGHRNIALQKDWTALGEENFVFEVLSELNVKDEESVNYNKELKTLQKIVIEEMKIPEDRRY
ncbi:MAG TPA: GIY-YIG nuclease family protein [Sunxiuqinia sp.]|nr:GIY-YIG nuclease family protein [Sunxiuqinia sp.]